MNPLPGETLERKAAEQRHNLRASMEELKGRVQETLDVERHLGEHVWMISAFAALTAVSVGYGFAGLFSRR